jgi:hypothetical protein
MIDLPLRERVWAVQPVAAVDVGALAIGDMAMPARPPRCADRLGIVRLHRPWRAVRIGELAVRSERTRGSSDDGRQRHGAASLIAVVSSQGDPRSGTTGSWSRQVVRTRDL